MKTCCPLIANGLLRFLTLSEIHASRWQLYNACNAVIDSPRCSLADVCRILRSLGASVSVQRISIGSLDTLSYPFLTLLVYKDIAALATVTHVTNDHVFAWHPNYGQWSATKLEFAELWNCVAIRITDTSSVFCDVSYSDLDDEVAYKNTIRVVDGVCDSEECAALIALATTHCCFSRSKVTSRNGEPIISALRTSFSVELPEHDLLVQKIKVRVALLIDCNPFCFENIQCVRYDPGQEFRAHFDRSIDALRLRSCVLYLNHDFVGGATYFPELDLTVKPRAGRLLVFNNIGCDGENEILSLHTGMPILSGTKYACNIWETQTPSYRAANHSSATATIKTAMHSWKSRYLIHRVKDLD